MNRRDPFVERARRRDAVDVAIVGGGMIGGASALALAQAGFDVCLVESREPPAWRPDDEIDPRVVALAPSSVRLLDRLGVWSAIRAARAAPFRRMHVWDAASGAALDFDAADLASRELGFIVENRLVQHVLWQAILRETRIERRCPAQATATDADDAVRRIVLDDDTHVAARLVVAADGANSPLRAMVGIDVAGHDYGQRALVAHVATARPHEDTAWQRFLPEGPLAFLPLADGRSSIVWSMRDAECARVLALDDAAFRAELGCAFDFRLGPIEGSTARLAFPLRLNLATRYLAPRFALLGDAAHQVHPLAGQGANLGLRDVEELVEVLAAARKQGRDFASESTLRRYERRRRSDNAIGAYGFDIIDRVFRSDNPLVADVRAAGLTLVNATPLKHLFAKHAAGKLS